MKAINIRTGKELATNVTVAANILTRMKGLLGRKELPKGEALWIKPCMSVHMFFMKFPIDVVFLDKRHDVVAIIRNLQPNRLTSLYPGASSVVELPAGMIDASNTEVGDKIEIG